ncbi:MAG TPA: hypothetical protein VF721_08415 [Pyrinomonadaceae bacterium]|jgi:hypothetical protein
MHEIPHPSMALNAPGLYPMRMWNTREVADNVTPIWLVRNIVSVALSAPETGKLAALVINCHSYVTEDMEILGLKLGTGIYYKDISKFNKLKNRVDAIYVQSCALARGEKGKAFCKKLARETMANVYAAENDQLVPNTYELGHLKPGLIDDYEGPIYKFGPGGEMTPQTFKSVLAGSDQSY